jgi:hypothetical protein
MKISPPPPTVEFLHEWEELIRKDKAQEHAALYDVKGQLIGGYEGILDRTEIPDEDIERAQGGLLTHNHPRGKPPSCDDLRVCLANLITVRAVGNAEGEPPTTYVLTPHAKFPGNLDELQGFFDLQVKRAEYAFQKNAKC